MKKFFKNIGPGPLVAAAFIGPGTVTICTLAGADFGYALLWAMVLSIVATVVLQEMAARLGIITQKGLSDVIRSEIKQPQIRAIVILLILSAIVIGNTAYEAGNISGGVLGLEVLTGNTEIILGAISIHYLPIVIGLAAFTVLFIGSYKLLERFLVALVILMSLAFITTAFIVGPNIAEIFKGIAAPSIPEGSMLTIVGLIGTTVVPYNLFLHASLVKEKWGNASDLGFARKDTLIAVILGGIVSMSIIICSASLNGADINNASDLALALEPLFGTNATYIMAIGLGAAGITSAITAPLAAAYVATGCLGWSSDLKSKRFRVVWIVVLLMGVLSASSGVKSIEIIKFAQFANGLVLPLVAGILIWMMNNSSLLGRYKNSKLQNVLGIAIVIITILLGLKGVLSVFELI
ncbi:Nramp family divalent metal transporter [Winogradskyella sp. A3E31]|uniref:Nramp family divalent metal transporter n=1 Tax=Winogradskyella sp. A3E31 TaxID=3349637 RepID=UPI00398AD0D3